MVRTIECSRRFLWHGACFFSGMDRIALTIAIVVAALGSAHATPPVVPKPAPMCVENPLEGMERPPRDTSECPSFAATVRTIRAVAAEFFRDCALGRPEVGRKYSEIASRYVGMPWQAGLPMMFAELANEGRKDGTRCAIRAVVKEGLPVSSETREQLVTVVNVFFEAQDVTELFDDIAESAPLTAAANLKRDALSRKFANELNDRVAASEELRGNANDFQSLRAKVIWAITDDSARARAALGAVEESLATCRVVEAAKSLSEAVAAGQRALQGARREIRASERAAECAEINLRLQYGEAWNLRQAVIAGPTLDQYRSVVAAIQRLKQDEKALVALLRRAGESCLRLKQQVGVRDRLVAHHTAAKARAMAAIDGRACDGSGIEEAAATLRALEGATCGNQAKPAANEVLTRRAVLRDELRRSGECSAPTGVGAGEFQGPWQCPQRGTLMLQGSATGVSGSVSGRPGEHWGTGQREGGRIGGTVEGRTLRLTMESGDGTTSRMTATLSMDGRTMSGPWEWFRGPARLDGGTWSCQRPAGYAGGGTAAGRETASRRTARVPDMVIPVAGHVARTGGGTDPYQTLTVRAHIEPEWISWIAWNDRRDVSLVVASRPNQKLLGPGGFGTDDYIDLTVTDPLGRSMTVKMDQNDKYGASYGPQNLILGSRANAPAAYRKIPFGPTAGQELFFDQDGAFNSLFTKAGQYTFTFAFRDNEGGRTGYGHTSIFLIIAARQSALEGTAASGAPVAPGSKSLSFGGRVLDVRYERQTDERGVPIDLYFYRTAAPPGVPAPAGEAQWSRFVRVPADGGDSSEPAVWWHSRWEFGPNGWTSMGEKDVAPPQAVTP
jgi:hypothetical protein